MHGFQTISGCLLLAQLAAAGAVEKRWTYPDCEPDNCYRNLIDDRFKDEAKAFCPQFLAGTTTAPSAIPTDFNNCDGNIAAVSSACSCITYVSAARQRLLQASPGGGRRRHGRCAALIKKHQLSIVFNDF
ncbi:hypothetical protein GQ53DRAFT_52325 [Thozetella sp. PMI_491]|nr:hypothetical protein GQ53DRAFT_52325 [Thozetella sp. PMI_491]